VRIVFAAQQTGQGLLLTSTCTHALTTQCLFFSCSSQAGDYPYISKIHLKNFMCHHNFTTDFIPEVRVCPASPQTESRKYLSVRGVTACARQRADLRADPREALSCYPSQYLKSKKKNMPDTTHEHLARMRGRLFIAQRCPKANTVTTVGSAGGESRKYLSVRGFKACVRGGTDLSRRGGGTDLSRRGGGYGPVP